MFELRQLSISYVVSLNPEVARGATWHVSESRKVDHKMDDKLITLCSSAAESLLRVLYEALSSPSKQERHVQLSAFFAHNRHEKTMTRLQCAGVADIEPRQQELTSPDPNIRTRM